MRLIVIIDETNENHFDFVSNRIQSDATVGRFSDDQYYELRLHYNLNRAQLALTSNSWRNNNYCTPKFDHQLLPSYKEVMQYL